MPQIQLIRYATEHFRYSFSCGGKVWGKKEKRKIIKINHELEVLFEQF